MEINGIDLETLDIQEIGSWPRALRMIVASLICALVLFLGAWLVIGGQLNDIDSLQNQKVRERSSFAEKYEKSSNIEAYKQQMVDMKKSYSILLEQLPSHNNVEALNKDISELASASGLSVLNFQPQADKLQGFYGSRSILLSLEGNYNNYADFASSISNMERIVTLHDFSIKAKAMTEASKKEDKNHVLPNQYPLTIELEARTYWYLGEEKKS